MKKILALLLALLMLLMTFSFAACSNNSSSNNKSKEKEEEKEDDDDEDDDDEDDEDDDDDDDDEDDDDGKKNNTKKLSIDEITAFDNSEFKFVITGLERTDDWGAGYALKGQIENKSSEKSYTFSIERITINDVEVSATCYQDIAAGKKANVSTTIYDSDLEDIDVGDYTDFEVFFRIYDSEDWRADDIANTSIHIYPFGEDKAVKYERAAQPGDKVLFDNSDFTVTVTGYEDDEDTEWGYYSANLYIVNKTNKKISFSTDDESVNGFMIDPYWATTVYPGKCSFTSIDFSKSSLQENGIDEVSEIEFKFVAYDYDTYDNILSETVTLNP